MYAMYSCMQCMYVSVVCIYACMCGGCLRNARRAQCVETMGSVSWNCGCTKYCSVTVSVPTRVVFVGSTRVSASKKKLKKPCRVQAYRVFIDMYVQLRYNEQEYMFQ